MKMRDQVIDEIRRLPIDRVVLVSELLSVLNRPVASGRQQVHHGGRVGLEGGDSRPEVRVREALAGLGGALSDDIASAREDRV